ncbi:MAG: hypothetical protein JW771_03025 [Candidatus Thermoplasmatota archaeon]|nr:hypothetical protein [Candidatus Thermoplasmatota archaeon]
MEKPRLIYVLSLLLLTVGVLFLRLGIFSIEILLDMSNWYSKVPVSLIYILHFWYLVSAIASIVLASSFFVLLYATIKRYHWARNAGIVLSTLYLIVFGMLLAALMVNSVIFHDEFSIASLVTIIVAFFLDFGIVFLLTRPAVRLYFQQPL